MPKPKVVNPFYILLLLAGCAFAITACAYGVMTVKQLHRGRAPMSETSASAYLASGEHDRFSELMDTQGPRIMLVELVLLGISTVGAMAFDHYAGDARQHNSPPSVEFEKEQSG